MKLSKIVPIAFLSTFAFNDCSIKNATMYPDVRLHSEVKYTKCTPSKEAFETLLAKVWSSEFLDKNERVKRELLDNYYGSYQKDNPPEGCENGIACFYPYEGTDNVLIRNDQFCREYKIGEETIILPMNATIDETLVHELFHDFWYDLLDQKAKEEFKSEVKKFYTAMENAETKEQKLEVLISIGVENPKEEDYKPFAALGNTKHLIKEKLFFGTELYSILAEEIFDMKIIVPKPLRQFYQGIISDTVLNNNKMVTF